MSTTLKFRGRALRLLVAFGLLLAAVIPLSVGHVNAAQITARKVTIDKSYVTSNTDVGWAFSYTLPTTGTAKQGIIYQFCTTPLGTCTLPTGMAVQAATMDVQGGWPANGTNFTSHAVSNEGDCDMTTTSSKMCFERSIGTAGGGAVTQTISNITAPSSAQTVYVRISIYNLDTFASGALEDTGVVAAAFVNQLTISGRVQEVLQFCVGTDDGGTDCTGISGTAVDLGVIDSAAASITPVVVGSGGNNKNGLAMVRTNAQSGVVVTYYAEQNTSSGKLKVPGATCSGVVETDQCFNSATTTQTNMVVGTENFGMTISSVDTSNGGATTNITRDTQYDGDGTAGGGWAWDDTGTVDIIASSSSVVDDEMLVMRFAALADITTPTGSYAVTSTFVATPTF